MGTSNGLMNSTKTSTEGLILEQHNECAIILVYIFRGLLISRRTRDELSNDLAIWYLKFSVKFMDLGYEGRPTLTATGDPFSKFLSGHVAPRSTARST